MTAMSFACAAAVVFFASLFAAFVAAHGSRRLIMSAGAALIMVLTGAAAVLGDRRSKTPVDVVAVPPPEPHTEQMVADPDPALAVEIWKAL